MATFAKLAGRRVFITGAASGIGYELALAFAAEGADIVAADIRPEGLAALASSVEAAGRTCRQVTLDVTDESAFSELFAGLSSEGELPDIVINNAGIGFMGRFTDCDDEVWQRVLDINVRGVANGCRAFLRVRGDSSEPALLVNVASAATISPMPNMSVYAASKWAVEGMSEVLAMELEETSVDVMTVHPGIINTPIVSHPEYCRVSDEQLARLQTYYSENGAPPAQVAQDVVAGVKSGTSAVLTGSRVRLTDTLKRLLPRRRFRRVLNDNARLIGYR